MDFFLSSGLAEALAGLVGGLLLGLAARRGRFCTLGALEDVLYARDWTRCRMWALALGLSIVGVQLGAAAGVIDVQSSIYSTQVWDPIASIVGGLMFGYGMAIAGNCGFGALARLGGGDIRAFVIVLVLGISAYITASGPLAFLRVALFPPLERADANGPNDYAGQFADVFGISPIFFGVLFAVLLISWAISSRKFRMLPANCIWSGLVAVAILIGWLSTTYIANVAFEPVRVESYTFSLPPGETILYLMTASGGGLSFGVGSVAGVVIGALIGCLSRGHFHWEACDDARELGRHILGACLMGIGGVIALGCSVGQGLTAFSTLAYSAPVVALSITVGAIFGLRQLVEGLGSRASN